MQIQLPEQVNYMIEQLNEAGYEAYAVGGCVRDSLLGRIPEDWDVTTSATPEQVKSVFPRTFDTGIEHGTVTVLLDHEGYEVTTYRIDGAYEDARHPKEVTFTSQLVEDLKRRDFTINAMAYNEQEGLVDVFEGQRDLREGRIRCVGDPMERFSEDALRMLRAVRFSAQLDFEISKDTKAAILQLSGTLEKISVERIQTELVKLLVSDHPEQLRLAYELGMTKIFLPEFDVMMETPQNNPHHKYSVGEHTLKSLELISADRILRLTMLFHDIAKPDERTTDENGIDHFYGHQLTGERKTKEILRRLKFDNDTIRKVCIFVKWHDTNPAKGEKYVRRLVSKIGAEQFPQMFWIKKADIMAQSTFRLEEKLSALQEYEDSYNAIIAKDQCLCMKQLAVNGRDLMELGIPSGEMLGARLKQLLDLVIEEPEKNTKEILMTYVKEHYL